MEQEYTCSICSKKGDIVKLDRKNDSLVCHKCGGSWVIEGVSPLCRYQETWKDNSQFLFAMLRPEPPSNIVLDPGLKALYEDCYQTLLAGRYNASIVMMGIFLEALMKERIRLETDKDFMKPYKKCTDKLSGIDKRWWEGDWLKGKWRYKYSTHGYLIEPIDILFLDRFRERVRNLYTHFDESSLVQGRIMEGWEIPIDTKSPEGLLTSLKASLDAVKAGERKPMLLLATHPALRSISKIASDPKVAIELFNLVYDFMIGFVLKYLRQKDYDEYHRRYPHPFVDLSPILDIDSKKRLATLKIK